MPWSLYLAIKHLFPTGRWVSFHTVMSALGIALGVGVLVVTTSIMGGWGYEIRRMIIDTQGEIRIVANGLVDPNEALAILAKNPQVQAAAPFASGYTMLKFDNKPIWGPIIQGFDLERIGRVVPFQRYLVTGSLDDLDDDSLILSTQLANSLGVGVGDSIDIYSPLMLEQKSDTAILPRTVRVAGTFEIGHPQLDKSLAISSLRLMQELYGLGHGVHGIMVRLKPGAVEADVAVELNRTLPRGLRAITWLEANRDFQSIIQLEKYMIFIVLMFIIVVAAASIMSSLLISVVRKTREIGLIGALGGYPGDVAVCFCAQGLFLGLVGTAAGLGLGFTVLAFRHEIVRTLARLTVSEATFQEFYGFVNFPSHTSGFDLTLIIVGALVCSTLAGLIPAWRASRLKPVEALRSE